MRGLGSIPTGSNIFQWIFLFSRSKVSDANIVCIKTPVKLEFFPVCLRMALIFTDFPTGSGSQPCALLEIYEYQRHP